MVNHKWTVTLLIVFAVIVSSGQYVGDPIHCWCPAHFTRQYVSYAKQFCWISNTYYIPMGADIRPNIPERQEAEISYYQWVPLILMFQALLFKLPNIAWHLLNTQSGLNLSKLCMMVDAVQLARIDKRAKAINHIASYIDRWLLDCRHYHRNFAVKIKQKLSNLFIFCSGRREGQFLTFFYLFVKLMYFCNCILQFYILNSFLAINYWLFGIEAINCWLGNCENMRESPRFPRVTMCDFEIRQLENVQRYTVQCVLPINLFNEKMFTLLWFWIFLVGMCNLISLMSWLLYMLHRKKREHFVRKYIWDEVQTGYEKKMSKQFANEYLRNDGCFALRIVQINTTDIILADVMRNLWNRYKETLGRNVVTDSQG